MPASTTRESRYLGSLNNNEIISDFAPLFNRLVNEDQYLVYAFIFLQQQLYR